MGIQKPDPRSGRRPVPARREAADPVRDLQRQMNRLFADFLGEVLPAERAAGSAGSPAAFMPRVDVSETDTEVKVSAELPGMDEQDISVELQGDRLILRGEKKSEQEAQGKNWFRREQAFGSFQRAVELPAGVDPARAVARFQKGVLTFVAPKRADEQARRKTVPIRAE